MSSTSRPSTLEKWVWILVLIAFSLPAGRYVTRLEAFGPSPSNDYFPTIDLLRQGDRWSTDLGQWLSIRSNEHRCVIPAVVYRANAALFDGDNRGHGAWGLLMMGITGLALVMLLPAAWRRRPVAMVPAALLIAIFAFSPLAVHNIARGFSGVMWLTANALAIGALALVHNFPRHNGALIAAALCAVGAHFTYSTGLMVWPALLILMWLQGQDRKRVAAIGALAVVLLSLFVLGYKKPHHNPELNQGHDLKLLARYASVYLGSSFLKDEEAADAIGNMAMGMAVLSWMLAVAGCTPCRRRRLLAPWAAVALFAVANILGTGVGRSGYGAAQALASRYGTISGFFWLAVLIPPLILTFERLRPESPLKGRLWTAGAWIVFIVLFTYPVQQRGTELFNAFERQASFQPAVFAALLDGIPDFAILSSVTPRPDQLWQVRPFLKAQSHIPFDRPATPWPEGRLPPSPEPFTAMGSLDSAMPVATGWVRLSGWAFDPERDLEDLQVVDAEGEIVGRLVHGSSREDVERVHGPRAGLSGFFAWVRAEQVEPPKVWVRHASGDGYSELPTLDGFSERWSEAREEALSLPAPERRSR